LTTVLAFSVRVSTGCVSFVMRLRMSRPPCSVRPARSTPRRVAAANPVAVGS
jgi:hypothetical protein